MLKGLPIIGWHLKQVTSKKTNNGVNMIVTFMFATERCRVTLNISLGLPLPSLTFMIISPNISAAAHTIL